MRRPFNFNMAPTAYGEIAVPVVPQPVRERYDAVIVGGGLAGLSTAIELAVQGQKVLVLEARRIGAGASGRSCGQLWPGFERDLDSMQEKFGAEKANAAWSLVHDSLRLIHRRLASHPDRCGFRPGVLLAAMDEEDNRWCREQEDVFRTAGFGFARYVDGQTLRQKLYNTTLFTGGLLYEGQEPQARYGHLDPALYVQHLAQLAAGLGAELVENAPVTAAAGRQGAYEVTTPMGRVGAEAVVLATGAEFIRPQGIGYDLLPRHFVRAQTVILATEPLSPELAQEIVPGTACFCDTRESQTVYGRLTGVPDGSGRQRLLFGGADALSQVQTALAARQIRQTLYQAFPQLQEKGVKVERVWGGHCDLSPSALPVLAEVRPGMYQMSGFSGHGNVLTTTLASAVAERLTTGASAGFNLLASLTGQERPFNRFESVAKAGLALQMVGSAITGKAQEWQARWTGPKAS